MHNLKFAFRQLIKHPGFAAVAVLTLAFGIGTDTAIFSLVNAALLRELPFPASDRLRVIWAVNPLKQAKEIWPPANADIAEVRAASKSFITTAAFLPRTADIAVGGNPERIGAAGVTAGFFETLGVTPFLGRTLTAEEEAFGGPAVALIGYSLWQRRFGGDPALVGRSVSIDGENRTVIGVLPPEFDFPRGAEWPAYLPFVGRTEVWLPLALRSHDDGTGWSHWQSRNERMLIMFGRLKPGVSPRQAQAEMDMFAAQQSRDYPDSHSGLILKLVSLREQLGGRLSRALWVLFTAASLLLLIALTNVANLLLVRGIARQNEIAVRTALGASRGHLTGQLLAEGLLLSVFGCALGLVVAEVCLKGLLVLNPLPPSRLSEASLNLSVMGFAGSIALATGAVFALIPIVQTSRLDLRGSLSESGRITDYSSSHGTRGWLIAGQVALAFILLAVAGLMVRSFVRVLEVKPGFRSDSVLAFDVGLPSARYRDDSSQIAFFRELTEHLQALPGVEAAGAISYLPLGGGENIGDFSVEGEPPISPGNEPAAERRWITPGYFAAMGISIRQGRGFTSDDSGTQPKVVVVNETLARRCLRPNDPVGRRIKAGGDWRTIVGVVEDVKSNSLESDVRPQLYIPNAQWAWGGMTVVVQTHGDPLSLVPAVRREMASLDTLLPAANVRTMKQVISNASNDRRFNLGLLAFYAFAALLLTMLGIYGLVAFQIGRRQREIGIRMALGASRADVLRLVLMQGMKPVAVGGLAGLGSSLIVSRLLAAQLFGVSFSDPITLSVVIVLLGSSAVVACWLPSRRATRVDPIDALRYGG